MRNKLSTQKWLTLILTCAIGQLKFYITFFGFEVLNIMQAVVEEKWRWLYWILK